MTILLAGLLALPPQVQQTPPPPTQSPLSAISGIALDGSNGRPLAGALIYLQGSGGGAIIQTRQVTDPKGRFVFANLFPAEQYTLTGSKSGYLDGFNAPEGAAPGTSTPIRMAAGDWFQSARVVLYPPGAIGGRVLDESSAGVAGVDVRLLSRVRIQGRVEFATGPSIKTDDRGVFRFASLPPGQYVVMVPSVQTSVPSSLTSEKPRSGFDAPGLELNGARLLIDRYVTPPPPVNGRLLAYPATFYPGTTSAAEAGSIALRYAESRNDVEIHLAPVPTFRISGNVIGSKDALVNLTLRLLPAGLENLSYGGEAATALVDADGRFTFAAVPEGSYLLDGPRTTTELNMTGTNRFDLPRLPGPPGSNGTSINSDSVPSLPGIEVATTSVRGSDTPNFWIRMPLAVSSDVENFAVPLRPMGMLSGRVRFEADPAKKATPRQFASITLDPASGVPGLGMPRTNITADTGDEFSIGGLAPASYFIRFGGNGWMIKSITLGGRDYTFSPIDAASSPSISGIDVVLTNAPPTLSGFVTMADGAPKAGAVVLLFPADRARWTSYGLKPAQFATTVVGTNGAYQTSSLPAGEYYAVAVTGPIDDWMRPEFLDAASRGASRVTLTWGQSATSDLRVTEIRR